MLTEKQIAEDARSLIDDLVLDVKIRDLTLKKEIDILLEASKVLALASQALVKMIKDVKPQTMH